MSTNVNSVCLAGRLTHDPDVKITTKGTTICSFSLAVNESRKNEAGNYEDYVHFIDCTAFGSQADYIGKYAHKGQQVFVQGSLNFQTWERDGQKRSKVSVKVSNIDLVYQRQEQPQYQAQTYAQSYVPPQPAPAPMPQAQPAAQPYPSQPQPTYYQPMQPAPAPQQNDSVYDEDIPF